jgi:hypothetical protein
MITTIRSSHVVRLLIALGAAFALAGGAAGVAVQDAHAMPCDVHVPTTYGKACSGAN